MWAFSTRVPIPNNCRRRRRRTHSRRRLRQKNLRSGRYWIDARRDGDACGLRRKRGDDGSRQSGHWVHRYKSIGCSHRRGCSDRRGMHCHYDG